MELEMSSAGPSGRPRPGYHHIRSPGPGAAGTERRVEPRVTQSLPDTRTVKSSAPPLSRVAKLKYHIRSNTNGFHCPGIKSDAVSLKPH